MVEIIPCAQIRERGIITYVQFEGCKRSKGGFQTRSGTVNNQSIRRFKKYFDLMLMGTDVKENITKDGLKFTWRLNFITLTFPGILSKTDQPHKAFYSVLRALSRKGLRHYVWRKEIQEKTTKNPHLHIVSNAWIDYTELNKTWNVIVKRHCPDAMNQYFKKKGHYFPPSTEVKAIKNLRKCRSYAVKYLSKNGEVVPGNSFGVSRELSQLNYLSMVIDSGIEKALDIADEKEINDFTRWHSLPVNITLRQAGPETKKQYENWLSELRKKLN